MYKYVEYHTSVTNNFICVFLILLHHMLDFYFIMYIPVIFFSIRIVLLTCFYFISYIATFLRDIPFEIHVFIIMTKLLFKVSSHLNVQLGND